MKTETLILENKNTFTRLPIKIMMISLNFENILKKINKLIWQYYWTWNKDKISILDAVYIHWKLYKKNKDSL